MLDLLRATSELYGNCSKNPNSDIIYIDGVALTDEQLVLVNAKAKETDAEYENNQYVRDRLKEYAKLNQFDMQYEDIINGTKLWSKAIGSIKKQFPKSTLWDKATSSIKKQFPKSTLWDKAIGSIKKQFPKSTKG
tara:strand:+ start:655 stop:1059 length:405 start_codon:yes stop_codon:yes gene_type:complete